mgnify:CR=1 FL=1
MRVWVPIALAALLCGCGYQPLSKADAVAYRDARGKVVAADPDVKVRNQLRRERYEQHAE